ncbi:MAG: hypothetical protein AAFQ24_00475 [Pseudomonadota bacterium]
MWQVLRSVSDTLGVGFLIMQLIKLIGMVFTLVGPLKFISSLFAGLFPLIASFFKISFGWTINGLDVMAVAIAVSGTLIVWSSVAHEEAMGTKYIFRFFMIPYAFIVILFAIAVQVITPIVEINHFNSQCKSGVEDVSFYGGSCSKMTGQLAMWDDTFGEAVPPPEIDPVTGEAGEAVPPPASDDDAGLSFFLSIAYLAGILPLIALFVFFFKRLSVNKLLKRVVIAGASAAGLAIASAAYASAFG